MDVTDSELLNPPSIPPFSRPVNIVLKRDRNPLGASSESHLAITRIVRFDRTTSNRIPEV